MSGPRLFAALELPGGTRAALASWGARVSARWPGVRLVPADALHVTLVFLGEQPEAQLGAIGRAVVSEARTLGPLSVGGAAWLPPRRPGVLAAELVDDGSRLADLQAGLTEALAAWHEPETRAYRPHVTVARIRRGEKLSRPEVPAPPRLVFDPSALVLYRSLEGPGDRRYHPLARAPVGA